MSRSQKAAPGIKSNGSPIMSTHAAIAIPCHNAAPWIGKAVRSALDQSFRPMSVIVVDDSSTDDSLERLAEFGDRIIVEAGPHHGACHARNRGLALAIALGASHILFLDADDYLEGDMLAGAMETAITHDADMVLSNMHLEYADGRRERRQAYEGRVSPKELFSGWMEGNYVNPSGILWRSDFISRIGRWDESLARGQDFEITMRALFHTPVIHKNEKGCAIHTRVNANSITADQSRSALSSRFSVVTGLIERIRGTPFAEYHPQLCRELYHIARAAFIAGYPDLGREALARTRAEGYRKHPGTRLHAMAAGLLGLEMKTRIWKGKIQPRR